MFPVSMEEITSRRTRGTALLSAMKTGSSPEKRLGVLSSFNVDSCKPFLLEALERYGTSRTPYFGPFGQMAEEILNPASGLYQAKPDHVVLIPAVEDLLAPIFERPAHVEDPLALVEQRWSEMVVWIETLLERIESSTCHVVLLGTDRLATSSILDPRASLRGQAAVESLLAKFRMLSEISARVCVVDLDWQARSIGYAALRDERLWYLGRMRLSPVGLATLAECVGRSLAAVQGKVRKVAVLDLDNTLWGGVIGEAGLKGIKLGDEGIGLAFQDFQRELLKLHDSGIVLALCSKNEAADAWEVFDRHPGMILKRDHIAAARINWQDKATNISELAEELNLGLDSFVFFDDSPFERDWVTKALPMVAVPSIPEDPTSRPEFLRKLAYYLRTNVTDADRKRTESYRADGLRRELKSKVTSFEDFLVSLDLELTIAPVDETTIARGAQLCQRTNQFNLTTVRHALADLERFQKDANYRMYTMAVRDRFGDSGITGLAILRREKDDVIVDTFLMSCRVLGRKLETAFLRYLVGVAKDWGASRMQGIFIPSAKNAQVANFYPDHGFVGQGEQFQLDLAGASADIPMGIKLNVKGQRHAA
ncbi:MAG: HAD-IIIC family phosphatase [Planctomycetota bacterium]